MQHMLRTMKSIIATYITLQQENLYTHKTYISTATKGRRKKSSYFFVSTLPFPKPKSPNTLLYAPSQLLIRKIKKRRRFAGYSLSSCRSSGNKCGWFSRNLRNGELIDLYFGMLIANGSDQSLSAPYAFFAFTLIS
ncbi:hypothetical protein MBGDC06_00229 [Thermoplasmatales archaeon SCGC AB-539-C06]|nr:hypothetical protein MBGDC06_00229 [Thermoplasmatales archaeon SCGC AB-539-C06]